MRWSFAVALLPGCAQLFGIDTTSKAPDGPAPGHTTLAFQRYSIGASIQEAPQSTAGLDLAIFFSNGTAVASTTDGAQWSADVAATSVEFFLPDFPASIPRVWQLPYPDQRGLFGVLELVRNRTTKEPMAPFNGTSPEMAKLGAFLRDQGMYAFINWNNLFTNPPLCISEEQLRDAFVIIDRGLAITDAAVTG